MNRTPVAELSEGLQFDQSFRAADKQLRVNRQGNKYILLRLADRSGVIAGMIWNADERLFESFQRGDFVKCQGRTQVHNGALQVIVQQLQRLEQGDVDVSEFERFDVQQSKEVVDRLHEILGGLRNVHLRQLGQAYLADQDLMDRLKVAAAGVNNHHAYPGGLLRHTVDLMELSVLIAPRFPQIDDELLLFGAFLHDLGKVDELSSSDEVSYTDRGQMVGHIVIGVQMLDEKIRELDEPIPSDLRLQLEHLIVSHHGQIEFGSPKLPVTLEAVALHHIDNLDAKIASYTSVIEADVSGDENWTNYNPSIGRKLWKKINS